jgi:hypothetical protein
VYVSFDDGDHWQSLRLNMAASSVRDLVVKDDDLVAATHGRGFWILDDITRLRQIGPSTAASDAVLFEPAIAWRVRWNTNTDTPLPPDEPAAPNPPEGALIDYWLKSVPAGPVTLEVARSDGRVIRRYSSADPVPPLPEPATRAPLPLYWYRPPQGLSAQPGMHRFAWDVHYQPLPGGGGGREGLPIAAVPYNTVVPPATPWASPGVYTVKLTVDGRSYTQPIVVKADPRVKTPAAALQQVYSLSDAMYLDAAEAREAAEKLAELRKQVAERRAGAQGQAGAALAEFDRKAEAASAVNGAAGALVRLTSSLQEADVQPTAVQLTAISRAREAARQAMARWKTLSGPELAALNAALKAAGLAAIAM